MEKSQTTATNVITDNGDRNVTPSTIIGIGSLGQLPTSKLTAISWGKGKTSQVNVVHNLEGFWGIWGIQRLEYTIPPVT